MARRYILNLCHDLALGAGAIPRHLQQMEVDLQPLAHWLDDNAAPGEPIEPTPWGWDSRVVSQYGLQCRGEQLEGARTLSSKAIVAQVLKYFEGVSGICGESHNVTTINQIEQLCSRWKGCVLKQIYSSSGRGLRFVTTLNPTIRNWVLKRLRSDGIVVAQPCLEGVLDAALEFEIGEGGARFAGYSVFFTDGGAWRGNLVAPQSELRQTITRLVGDETLDRTIVLLGRALDELNQGRYKGPAGVDILVCRTPSGYGLMPCLEVNARTTMGMLATALWERTGQRGVFKIGRRRPPQSLPLVPDNATARFTAWLEPET